jgi:hypothetical protein
MDVSARHAMLLKGWTRRRFGLVAGGAATALLGLSEQPEALARYGHGHHHDHHRDRHNEQHGHHGRNKPGQHAQAQLQPVNGSSVSGFVTLHQLQQGGTGIVVQASGLTPGTEYLSLYYDNSTCEVEPYTPEDHIGSNYVPNPAGQGHTEGDADDDLDEIHSVSVRRASDFALQACATIM